MAMVGLREVSLDRRRENTLGLGDHIWKQLSWRRGGRERVGGGGEEGGGESGRRGRGGREA